MVPAAGCVKSGDEKGPAEARSAIRPAAPRRAERAGKTLRDVVSAKAGSRPPLPGGRGVPGKTVRQLSLHGSLTRRKRTDTPAPDMLLFEKRAGRRGFLSVAGIDEAGRGPLAGPVVAAAVILPAGLNLPAVNDSKKLTPDQREKCFEEILGCAPAVGVGCIDAGEIDRMNILQATFAAMLQAVSNLRVTPDYLLIDGPYALPLSLPQEGNSRRRRPESLHRGGIHRGQGPAGPAHV